MSNLKENIDQIFNSQNEKAEQTKKQVETDLNKAKKYISETVIPELEKLKIGLERNGRDVVLDSNDTSASISIEFNGQEEFKYTVITDGSSAEQRTRRRDRVSGKMFEATGWFKTSSALPTEQEITNHFIQDYGKHINLPPL
jgi:hypothetical protein